MLLNNQKYKELYCSKLDDIYSILCLVFLINIVLVIKVIIMRQNEVEGAVSALYGMR